VVVACSAQVSAVSGKKIPRCGAKRGRGYAVQTQERMQTTATYTRLNPLRDVYDQQRQSRAYQRVDYTIVRKPVSVRISGAHAHPGNRIPHRCRTANLFFLKSNLAQEVQ